MSFNKPTSLHIDEFRTITKLYREGKTQRAIKADIDYERMRVGTYKGQGISTNTVSRLSPRSKHRIHLTSKIIAAWGEWNVSHHIAKCRHCSLSEARKIYWAYVAPVSPYDFYDPNQRGQVAVRVGNGECNAVLYFHFSTIGYDEFVFGDDPDYEPDPNITPDIWTVKSEFTYTDLLNGKVTLDVIMRYLIDRIDGAYEFEYINTTVLEKN